MPQVSTVGFDINTRTPAKMVSTDDSSQDASPGTPPTVAAPPPSAIKRAAARSSTYSADSSSPSSGFGASQCSPGMRLSSPVSASKLHRLSFSTSSSTHSTAPKVRKTAFPGITKLRLKLPTTPRDKPSTSSSSYNALSSADKTMFQSLELAADTRAAARELVTRESGFAGIRRLDLKLPAQPDSSNDTYKVQASRHFNLFPRSGLVVNTAASPASPASSAECSPDSYSKGRNSTGFPRRGLVVNTAVSSPASPDSYSKGRNSTGFPRRGLVINTAVSSPASSFCLSDSFLACKLSPTAWTVATNAERLAASNASTAVQQRHTAGISVEPWAAHSPVQLSHAAAWRRHQSSALQTDANTSCNSMGSSPSPDKDLTTAEMSVEASATTRSPYQVISGLKTAVAAKFGRRKQLQKSNTSIAVAAPSAVVPVSNGRCSLSQAEPAPASSPSNTMPDAPRPARCSAAVIKHATSSTSSCALQAAPAKAHAAPRRSARLAANSHGLQQAAVLQSNSDSRRSQSAAIKTSTAVRSSTRQAKCMAAPAQPPVLATKTTCSVSGKTVSGKAAVKKPVPVASHRVTTRSAAALAVQQAAASGKIEVVAKPCTSKASEIVQHAAAPTATARNQPKSSRIGRSTAAGVAQSQPAVKPRWT